MNTQENICLILFRTALNFNCNVLYRMENSRLVAIPLASEMQYRNICNKDVDISCLIKWNT